MRHHRVAGHCAAADGRNTKCIPRPISINAYTVAIAPARQKGSGPPLNLDVRRPLMYPSLLRRYLATTLDVIVIVLILMAYAQSPLSKTSAGSASWPALLFVVYEPVCNRLGTTLGQYVMGFRVRTMKDGRKVPLWRGFLRLFAKYLLGIISFIKMPVHKHRRALHDIISGTIAVEARFAQNWSSPAP